VLAQCGVTRLKEECAEDEVKNKKAARKRFDAGCACEWFPEDPDR